MFRRGRLVTNEPPSIKYILIDLSLGPKKAFLYNFMLVIFGTRAR